MLRSILKYLLFTFIICVVFTCKKPFQPVLKTVVTNNLLVVDGIVNTAPNAITTIKLSRARSLTDSTYDILPENNASATIESSTGAIYILQQTAGTAAYTSTRLNLDPNQTYRVHVTTSGGSEYMSGFVKVKQAPPVDSITWHQDSGVAIYAYAHDVTNNTRYYRWDFTETYQHDATYQISWGAVNGMITKVDPSTVDTYTYHCWTDSNSTSIILGTSAALTQDVISKALIRTVPANDSKIQIRYSILIRQYALTPEAYAYWGIIQKNTQNIGTLFDVQPSQLFGNVSSVTNKDEPVIGFISAGSVQEKRIFIDHLDLTNWQPPLSEMSCPVKTIGHDPNNFLVYDYPDTAWAPYYFSSSAALNITKKECLDCRRQGGTNIKPVFWQ